MAKKIPTRIDVGGGLEIEIASTKKINDGKGIELYLRAWQNGKQIGFGKNGDIDIERFLIYNPPKKLDIPKSLAHTISVLKFKSLDGKIIKGKRGRTIATFYPVAGANSPVDGDVGLDAAGTWASVRDAATGSGLTTSATTMVIRSRENGASGYNIARAITLFDTSVIGSQDVESAIISLYVTAISDDDNDGNDFVSVVTVNPAATNNIALADYGQFGTIEQHAVGQRKDLTGLATGQYHDWTLNATGISNINTGGITKFGWREGHDLLNDPITGTSVNNTMTASSADHTGTSQDPKLVIEFGAVVLITETINMTEVIDTTVGKFVNIINTVSITDTVSSLIDPRKWRTVAKNVSSWVNKQKS